GALRPGIAAESPAVRKLFVKSAVESLPPEKLNDIFRRVLNPDASPENPPTFEEKNLVRFLADNVPELKQAITKGVTIRTETPTINAEWLRNYLGIAKESAAIEIPGQAPIPIQPTGRTLRPMRRLTTGGPSAT